MKNTIATQSNYEVWLLAVNKPTPYHIGGSHQLISSDVIDLMGQLIINLIY